MTHTPEAVQFTTLAIVVEDHVIPVHNIAFAGPVHVTPTGVSHAVANDRTRPAYRVRFVSGGHVDLDTVTAEGFRSLINGSPF